jgi:hypothetical protein
MAPIISDKHLIICEKLARKQINVQQAKFLLISEGLTEQESDNLIDTFMSKLLGVYDILYICSLLMLCFIGSSILAILYLMVNR